MSSDEEKRRKQRRADQRYKERHPERRKAQNTRAWKKYNETHPERRKAATKKWTDNNKDHVKIYQAKRYQDNREEILERQKILHSTEGYIEDKRIYDENYRNEHKEAIKEYHQNRWIEIRKKIVDGFMPLLENKCFECSIESDLHLNLIFEGIK